MIVTPNTSLLCLHNLEKQTNEQAPTTTTTNKQTKNKQTKTKKTEEKYENINTTVSFSVLRCFCSVD